MTIILIQCNRKYKSGFITTTFIPSVNTLSLCTNGQHRMCFSSCTVMKSWCLQLICLEKSWASRAFWVHCKMQLLFFWMGCLLRIATNMLKLLQNGLHKPHLPHIPIQVCSLTFPLAVPNNVISLQDGIVYAKMDHPGLSKAVVQDLWNPHPCSHSIQGGRSRPQHLLVRCAHLVPS
jgi:hypothetical protein